MKKLLLSIAFLLSAMGMMAQTQVTTSQASQFSRVFRLQPLLWAISAGRLLSQPRNGRACARQRSSDRTRCRNLSSET